MKRVMLALACLALPTMAMAQTQEPLRAIFTASTDHAATSQNVDVVSHYELMIFAPGSTTNPTIFNVGKPAPVANQEISVTVEEMFAKLPVSTNCNPESPTAAQCYTAKIAAVGPGGRGESALSPPFALMPRAPAAPGAPTIRR
jgi:hypothetical protein